MALMEKVCECGANNCFYHNIDMYDMKRNHLQINPECRHKFKGLRASAVVVLEQNSCSDWVTYTFKLNNNTHYDNIYKHELEYANLHKWHGRYYADSYGYHTMKDKNGLRVGWNEPIRRKNELLVAVAVEGHDKLFFNYLDGKKSLRAFRKNMRKLFGYDIDITIDLRFNKTVKPHKLIDCYFGDF